MHLRLGWRLGLRASLPQGDSPPPLCSGPTGSRGLPCSLVPSLWGWRTSARGFGAGGSRGTGRTQRQGDPAGVSAVTLSCKLSWAPTGLWGGGPGVPLALLKTPPEWIVFISGTSDGDLTPTHWDPSPRQPFTPLDTPHAFSCSKLAGSVSEWPWLVVNLVLPFPIRSSHRDLFTLRFPVPSSTSGQWPLSASRWPCMAWLTLN